MKVIKIDIKQETLDLEPRPYYLFYRTDENIPAHWIKENVMPNDMVRLHTEEYKVFEFYNPYAKEPRINYLIKVKDKELVDTLVKIEQDVLDQKISRDIKLKLDAKEYVTREFFEDRLDVRGKNAINYVKSCSWWKRLFNKF